MNFSSVKQDIGYLLLALVLLVVTGIGVAFTTQEVRSLHGQLEALRKQHDQLLAEHSRLLIERGAIAAYQNVEQHAQEHLAMLFPEQVQQLEN